MITLRRIFLALFDAALLGAAVWVTIHYIDWSKQNAMYQAQQTVVRLYHEEEGTGSAVVIAPGRLLTAAHVVSDVEEGWEISDGSTFYGIEYIDHAADIAVIAAGVDCPCDPLVHQDPRLLEETLTVGHPDGRLKNVVTEGRWQGKDTKYHDLSTGQAMPGVSGGGVFIVRNGIPRLTGIVVTLEGAPVVNSPIMMGAIVPVYYLVGSVNQYQIKKALMCADNPEGIWCEDPFDAESHPERTEETEEGEEI